MMRLTKGETNELLNKISEDNHVYGLIFKLIYLYGKDGMSVLSLEWKDINLEDDTIRFKDTVFPLSRFVKRDLIMLSENSTGDFVFLEDDGNDFDNSIDVLRKRLRYYMNNTVKKLDVSHKVRHVALSITDLRRLRGQHLLLDGVGLDVIMELYLQFEGTSTQFKKYLEYDELMSRMFPCSSVDDLFANYTDLNIFDFEPTDESVSNFAVSYDDIDFAIYLDSSDDLGFVGDVSDDVVTKVLELKTSGLLGGLHLLDDCEYLSVGGFSFVKI